MKLQRIAYVLHIFPKLSETFVAGELAELRRRGVELRILSLLPPRAEVQHEIILRAGLSALTTYGEDQFDAVIREFRPQLLHAHFATEATAAVRKLAARHQLPFTFTAHGYDIHRKPPADFSERARAASAVVTVSEANAHYICERYNVPKSHLRIIPCGVDTERFAPPATRPGSNDVPWLVCVARHVKVKNLGLLLDTCAELRRRDAKFRCALIGDGPEHGALTATREGLGLTGIVEMPGALEQSDVLTWWQRATVGTLTSDNEGMPVCLMEAAACGVPVVAPGVGGVPELVVGGETGLLTTPGDAGAFADALETLLLHPELRQRMGEAARARAVAKFSVRRQVDQLLELWSEVVAKTSHSPRTTIAPTTARTTKREITVSDPFNAMADPAMQTLVAALDPERAGEALKRNLPRVAGLDGVLKLRAIRVIRHKPGKRCVIEYDVRQKVAGLRGNRFTLIGKVRARRSGNEGFRQQEMIWNAGFQADSPDRISVPEPVGVLAELKMWCQCKVKGVVSSELLTRPEGAALARRIAEAIHKLHHADLPTNKTHGMADELRILRECFDKLAIARPDLGTRVGRVMAACKKLGTGLPAPARRGIHRDFYPAQVIVGKRRLWLIDFDLFCAGDPALDAGNFLGHVIEQALREKGDPTAMRAVEQALEERFVELSGECVRPAVRAYTTLTLARHVYLSTQFPERVHLTEKLLELCEQRLC